MISKSLELMLTKKRAVRQMILHQSIRRARRILMMMEQMERITTMMMISIDK
jgi:hypothetical protein